MTIQTDEAKFLTEARAVPRAPAVDGMVLRDLPDAPLAMPEQDLAPARRQVLGREQGRGGWASGLRARLAVRT